MGVRLCLCDIWLAGWTMTMQQAVVLMRQGWCRKNSLVRMNTTT